jgi:hypothetical protein
LPISGTKQGPLPQILKIIKKIVREHYGHLYANKFSNLDEMDKFFKTQISKIDIQNIKSK